MLCDVHSNCDRRNICGSEPARDGGLTFADDIARPTVFAAALPQVSVPSDARWLFHAPQFVFQCWMFKRLGG